MNIKPIDVICQHSADGTIIPLRVRIPVGEDRERVAFTVKNYVDISHQGTKALPDGAYVTDETVVFHITIEDQGMLKKLYICYNPRQLVWTSSLINK